MDLAELERLSHVDAQEVKPVMDGLRKKYGGRFAPSIRLAGKKGDGGYFIHVKPITEPENPNLSRLGA
jgi:hypothetical protein